MKQIVFSLVLYFWVPKGYVFSEYSGSATKECPLFSQVQQVLNSPGLNSFESSHSCIPKLLAVSLASQLISLLFM